jgi:hypothetical protein
MPQLPTETTAHRIPGETQLPPETTPRGDKTPRGATTPRGRENHQQEYDLPYTRKLIEYIHGMVGLLVKSQFLKAVKNGNFKSFPGLIVSNVSQYCPANATHTILGHMTQVQQGLQSTKSARSIAFAAILRKPDHPAFENHIDPSMALFNFITAPANKLQVCVVPTATLFTNDTA